MSCTRSSCVFSWTLFLRHIVHSLHCNSLTDGRMTIQWIDIIVHRTLMTHNIWPLIKLLTAILTRVWLNTRMASFMTTKATRLWKPFVAVFAFMWSYTRMNKHVMCQVSLPVKLLLTHITNVSFIWLCASVFVHVIHEVLFLCETLSTVGTSKHILSRVRSFMPRHVAF